jgi:predicted transcriptional regulator
MEALYLKSQKYRHKEITKLLRITEPTLLSYLQDYKAGGVEKLKELTFNRPQSEMKKTSGKSREIFSRTSSKEFSPCGGNHCATDRDCA